MNSLFISNDLIDWLQQLINERIQADLLLNFNMVKGVWELSNPFGSNIISFNLIPSLYKLGPQPHLPCVDWTPNSEGFSAIESHLPAPGIDKISKQMLRRIGTGFVFEYDIFGLAYWMLARCEEVNPDNILLDNHGRFSSNSCHAYNHKYLERPIVDEWLGILRQLANRIWPCLTLHNQHFRIIVSHDVDEPSAFAFGRKRTLIRSMAARIIKQRKISGLSKAPLIRFNSEQKLHQADPFNTFEWLMDKSDGVGIRSAFYFICGRTNPRLDAQYEPEHPAIRSLMRRIHQRGHEIGLHPSYNTFESPDKIASEAIRLKRICTEEGIKQPQWGGRMHFLRWKWPISAYGWEQAGFHYDSTLSYADRPGFRCGTCHEYKMFDPVNQRVMKLIQRPLIVMESSVISKRYLNLGYGQAAMTLFERLKRHCKAVNGNFTLLWHNTHLTNDADLSFYSELIS